jgi:hypothetical protein
VRSTGNLACEALHPAISHPFRVQRQRRGPVRPHKPTEIPVRHPHNAPSSAPTTRFYAFSNIMCKRQQNGLCHHNCASPRSTTQKINDVHITLSTTRFHGSKAKPTNPPRKKYMGHAWLFKGRARSALNDGYRIYRPEPRPHGVNQWAGGGRVKPSA